MGPSVKYGPIDIITQFQTKKIILSGNIDNINRKIILLEQTMIVGFNS